MKHLLRGIPYDTCVLTYGMDMQKVLLTLVGATVSIILAMLLVWYSKKTIAKAMSRRHILHMLKAGSMGAAELADAAKKCNSPVILHKLVPVILVKLQEEGLVQKASNNKYVITTNGIESLKNLDSMNNEFRKVAKIIQKTSAVSKFLINDMIDRFVMISSIDETGNEKEVESAMPVYGTDKQ